MFMYSFDDKVNSKKDLLLLVKHFANNFHKLYRILYEKNEDSEE